MLTFIMAVMWTFTGGPPANELGVGADAVSVILKTNTHQVMLGEAPEMTVTVKNIGEETIRLMKPGPGCLNFERPPKIWWNVREASDPEYVLFEPARSRSCAVIGGIRAIDIVNLLPGRSVTFDFRDYIGSPRLEEPGQYLVSFVYRNDPRLAFGGGKYDEHEIADARATYPVYLESNAVRIKVIPPTFSHSSRAIEEPMKSDIWFILLGSLAPREGVTTPNITLRLNTEKIFSTMSYSIRANASVEPGKIVINLLGIDSPIGFIDCALGHASRTLVLDVAFGKHKVVFKRNDDADEYSLLLSETGLKLTPVETSFSRPHHTSFMFAPRNSVGIVCTSYSEKGDLCKEFLRFVQSQIDFTPHEFPETCCWPYPTGKKYFTYHPEDFGTLIALFQEYSWDLQEQNRDLSITMYTWEREVYGSHRDTPSRNLAISGEWAWWINPLTPNRR